MDLSDIFTKRKKEELPLSLKALCTALLEKPVTQLNLSHNAFGPTGLPGCDFFLVQTPTITELEITNCGLGPVRDAAFDTLRRKVAKCWRRRLAKEDSG